MVFLRLYRPISVQHLQTANTLSFNIRTYNPHGYVNISLSAV
jgi:hypothetical protein